jgi:hypothetical protein
MTAQTITLDAVAAAIRTGMRENFSGADRVTLINDLLELHARAAEAGLPADLIHHQAISAGIATYDSDLDETTQAALRAVAATISDLRFNGRI